MLDEMSLKDAVRLLPTDVLALMMELMPEKVRGVHVSTLLPLSGSWKNVLENYKGSVIYQKKNGRERTKKKEASASFTLLYIVSQVSM